MVRLPAEWEPQEALWLSWPVGEKLFPGALQQVRQRWAEIAVLASRYQKVCINVVVGEVRDEARRLIESLAGVDERASVERIHFLDISTDDVWIRDHGPLFVQEGTGLKAIDFTFNAWGGKFPPWDCDNSVPSHISGLLSCPIQSSDLVCEGGALETNGRGLLLTTESVLLNDNRNPDWGRESVEAELRQLLGVAEIAWLPGGLMGDDTDGHIDTLARFYGSSGVVHCVERSKGAGANARILDENRERLAGLRTESGGRFDLAPLPLPEPIPGPAGWREAWLPGTYANFVVLNSAVLVPTYDQPKADDHACGLLRELFPGREVFPIDCLDILLEGGALHCLTLNQPEIEHVS